MKRYLIAGAALTALGVSATAGAQTSKNDYAVSDVAIKGGGFFPIDNGLRSISKAFYALGVEYTFPQQYFKGSDTYISVEWFSHSINGQSNNFFPIAVNQRFYVNNGYKGNRGYWFVGLGPTVLNAGSSKTVIGARGGIGTDIGPHFFAEAAGYLSQADSNGVHLNGFATYIGYRF